MTTLRTPVRGAAESALPKPYYQDDAVTIYHGDCRELNHWLNADLLLTDPPYGIRLASHDLSTYFRRPLGSIFGDDDQAAGQCILDKAAELGIPTLAFAHPLHQWKGKWTQALVWDKGPAVGGGGNASTMWKLDFEMIQVARMRVLNGARERGVIASWITPDNMAAHPTAKPEALLRYLVRKASQPGDEVSDPFMGAGSTLVAAKNEGRRAIGIEIEERYCEIAAKRCAQEVLAL